MSEISLTDTELAELRDMLQAWVDEGFSAPPYRADVTSVLKKFGVEPGMT